MTARKQFAVDVEVGRRTVWFSGNDRRLHDALKTVRCPKQRDQRARAWMVPIQHADDVIAALEFQFGAECHVRAVDR